MTLQQFNNLTTEQAREELFKCCGCGNWADELSLLLPFSSVGSLKGVSDEMWSQCSEKDFLEAFSHHPKIGDVKSLEKKFASTQQWASGEQAAVSAAPQQVLEKLAEGNNLYEKKFGYIFIVCATGKSAAEMLDLLNQRLPNSPEQELKIAASEQNKITHIRIDKLFA